MHYFGKVNWGVIKHEQNELVYEKTGSGNF